MELLDNQEATEKVLRIRETMTDADMCLLLGVSKMTFYKRLRTREWKITELALITQLKETEA